MVISIKRMNEVKIAKERIELLFEEAEKTEDEKLKNRYVELARKIAMKYNVKIPKPLKRRFCKYCYNFFIPGKNVQIKTKNKYLMIKCLNCRKIMRFCLR